MTAEIAGLDARFALAKSMAEEAGRLANPGYRQRIARALFHGIHSYAEARNRVATLGQVPGSQ